MLCNQTNSFGKEWATLCEGDFVKSVDKVLLGNSETTSIHMVQIGAHTGFEGNDPFAKGISFYLKLLTPSESARVHWTFVEPSPPNFDRLLKNIDSRQHLCKMNAVNAAIVPDSMSNTSSVTFYSVDGSIDPETGYDSRSGKKLPSWVTQVSGLSMDPLKYAEREWKKQGLNMSDYVVSKNVAAKRYSELLREITGSQDAPMFVLIDTEGFDCDIISGIAEDSPYLPNYLIFEDHCGESKSKDAIQYLEKLGYTTKKLRENVVAFRH